MKNGSLLGFDT